MTNDEERKAILDFVETNHSDLKGKIKKGFVNWLMNNPDYRVAILNGNLLPEPKEETPEEREEFLEWINDPEHAEVKEIFIKRISKDDPKCSCCGSHDDLEIVRKIR